MVDGRWLSNEGLAEAGDLGMLSWDFDLNSSEGRVGKACSGFNGELERGLPGAFSNERGWLKARLWCVPRGTFQIGRLLTSGYFCCAGTGDARGDVCTPVDTMLTLWGTGCCMAGLDDCGLSLASWGAVFLIDVLLERPDDATDDGFTPGAESTFVSGADAKASSASASVTRLLRVGSEVVGASPNSNF